MELFEYVRPPNKCDAAKHKGDPERGEIARSWGSVSLTRFDIDRSAKVNVAANKLFSSSSSSRGGRYPSSSHLEGAGKEGRKATSEMHSWTSPVIFFLEAGDASTFKAARAADCRARACGSCQLTKQDARDTGHRETMFLPRWVLVPQIQRLDRKLGVLCCLHLYWAPTLPRS
jgi:hypothetical protein